MKSKYSRPYIKEKKLNVEFYLTNRILDSFNSKNQLAGSVNCLNCFSSGSNQCGGSGGGGCGCFLTGTKVLMVDGTSKNINHIKLDDDVFSYEFSSKKLLQNKVNKKITHRNYPGGYFVINRKLKVTGNHRVWTADNIWNRVDQLKLGDHLLDSKGEWIRINSLTKYSGVNTVYNLHLANSNHNFYAGNALVHNDDLFK